MKTKSDYTDRRQQEHAKMLSIVTGVLNSNDFEKIERLEWLKQLYAEWQEKRNSIFHYDRETYLINEPDEFDVEAYWYGY
jgi:hypothetical protein